MNKINIAIDGPAGAGKGVTTKLLAKKLGYNYLDTGAMYRAIGYYLNEKGILSKDVKKEDLDNISIKFDNNNEILLNDENIEEEIRTPIGGELASKYSQIGTVRDFLGDLQKKIVKDKGFVAEGRDIGTVIIPKAELKIYLTATSDARAMRRLKDFEEKGIDISLDEIKKQIEQRDYDDMTRDISPLVKAPDAIEVDNSDLTIEEQINKIYEFAKELM